MARILFESKTIICIYFYGIQVYAVKRIMISRAAIERVNVMTLDSVISQEDAEGIGG